MHYLAHEKIQRKESREWSREKERKAKLWNDFDYKADPKCLSITCHQKVHDFYHAGFHKRFRNKVFAAISSLRKTSSRAHVAVH